MVIRCPLPRLVSNNNEYLVHQLPGLLNGLPVDLQPRRGHRGGEGPMDPGQQVVGEVARPPRGHHPPSFPSFSSSSTFSLFALNPHPASSPHSEKLWRAVLKLERVSPDDGGSFEVRWLHHRSNVWSSCRGVIQLRAIHPTLPPPPPPLSTYFSPTFLLTPSA